MQDQIAVRPVDRFPEPEFTELVDRLLHDPDRRAFVANFLSTPPVPPVRSDAQQVRVGAFDGETLVGWSHGVLVFPGVLYVSGSAVQPRYRRQGLYTRLVAAIESEALAFGCTRVESNHRAANSPVLIAKMKAGYTIVGSEFTLEMGLLVKMAKYLEPRRNAVFEARSGVVEGTARFFRAVASERR